MEGLVGPTEGDRNGEEVQLGLRPAGGTPPGYIPEKVEQHLFTGGCAGQEKTTPTQPEEQGLRHATHESSADNRIEGVPADGEYLRRGACGGRVSGRDQAFHEAALTPNTREKVRSGRSPEPETFATREQPKYPLGLTRRSRSNVLTRQRKAPVTHTRIHPSPAATPCRALPLVAVTLLASILTVAPRGAAAQEDPSFPVRASIDVGLNPHQIAFTGDGELAFVAIAGSDRVAVVDTRSYRILQTIPAPGVPLGVRPVPEGLAVNRFRSTGPALVIGSAVVKTHDLGVGASLFADLPDGRSMFSVENEDALWIMDDATFEMVRSFPVGDRPFPPAATGDGRLAFVPNYDDGSVTVIDLWNERIRATVRVGEHPSGGVVLPGGNEYAVAVRGENKIVFINTASYSVTGEITEGIGDSPFSVVTSPDGRLAFVNNTASHDVSVIALPERRVIARIPTPEAPIVMNVHPNGESLWVSSEGEDRLTVFGIPAVWRAPSRPASASSGDAGGPVTEVAVMGMIHDGHKTSEVWGLEQVRQTIRAFRPDVVCTEIAPNRWDRIWRELTQEDLIADPRVLRFPEYTDAILHLALEMGYQVVPCAGWSQEMSDLRETRIAEFETSPEFAEARAEYSARLAQVEAGFTNTDIRDDDPFYIHSDAYDERQRAELALYDQYQNDLIGPGGWTNINEAHYALIERTIREHAGQRVLITFGAGHKYWFLDRLKTRSDVRLLDLREYLPGR
jgi:YVTN family beta-propeller protein